MDENTEKKLKELRFNLCEESDGDYFSSEELLMLLERNGGSVRKASYEGLIRKSMDTSIQVAGLATKDTGRYFRSLASNYIDTNTGVLK